MANLTEQHHGFINREKQVLHQKKMLLVTQ